MKKESKNLYNALVSDPKSVFYVTNKITMNLIKKGKQSLYQKDIVFVNIYYKLENKDPELETLPLNTPFNEKKNKILFARHYKALVDLLKLYKQI